MSLVVDKVTVYVVNYGVTCQINRTYIFRGVADEIACYGAYVSTAVSKNYAAVGIVIGSRAVADEMLKCCLKVAPDLFKKAGPPCAKGACREGKMTCGKAAEMRKKI